MPQTALNAMAPLFAMDGLLAPDAASGRLAMIVKQLVPSSLHGDGV
jgi:hypothetical protein